MTDEKRLIKTLTKESERVSSKEHYFLPPANRYGHDSEFSAWHEHKNIHLSSILPKVSIELSQGLRKSQNLSKISIDELCPNSLSKSTLYLEHTKIRSIGFNHNIPYKVANISLNSKALVEHVNKSFEHQPRLPKLRHRPLVSIYFSPQKKKKSPKCKSNFAEVEQLLKLLKPKVKIPVKKKITTTLRSKSDLTKTLSRRKLSKSPRNFAGSGNCQGE
ncbi:hypothetical protein SteCoe_13714 [Stentor coeruleus]|uniref:Uncharacterized protein n=1 Tax=Stentor coeruleus TaxID=5963 RepID=A0A1R2C7T8_9CILI|nr:hypothetical protein SteCoe_13714 [Stentor coeruleus]